MNSTNKKKTGLFLRVKDNYYLVYTIIFTCMSLVVFSWYIRTGRTLIWEGDGWKQHYKAMLYYAEYLRDIFRNLVNQHKLIVPTWDFNFGEGNDILSTLHYYVIGDPIAFLAVFVPAKYMYIYYSASIILRLYLAGITFSALCFQTGHKGKYAVLAGSITYVFCYWAIYNAARHIFFLNPMIYLPLMIIGVEKILKKERPYIFIISVFIAAASNFYFFYMLALIMTVYVIVRLILLYKTRIKEMMAVLFKLALCAVWGVLLAAVIFFHMCYTFLGDARMSQDTQMYFLYPSSYYMKLSGAFVSGADTYWLCMGFAIPALLAIFLLFRQRKKYGFLKIMFIICMIITCIPALGQVLNGMSYRANRWVWAFALLVSYILTAMWPEMVKATRPNVIYLIICAAIYTFICIFYGNTEDTKVVIALVLCFIFLIIMGLSQGKHKSMVQPLYIMIIMACIVNNSYWLNSYKGDNYVSESKTIEEVQDVMVNEAVAVKESATQLGDNSFYRYSGQGLELNTGCLTGVSSTQYFWTLGNSYASEYRKDIELIENYTHNYKGLDERASLLTLDSVKYYAADDEEKIRVPYGFNYEDSIILKNKSGKNTRYNIYVNSYNLPLGYTYDKYILSDTWNQLSAVEKQEAMLQAVVLDVPDEEKTNEDINITSKSIDYTIKCKGKNIVLQNNEFVVTKENAKAVFKFKGISDSETYMSIKGLDFKGTDDYDFVKIKFKTSSGIKKKLEYQTPEYSYYSGRHDFTINLDYSEEGLNKVTVTFPKPGVYSFDSIDIVCQPMSDYKVEIDKLKENVLENIEIGTDVVTGTISLNEAKLLCMTIPYSKGWSAYVDGEKTELLQANVMYMALPLEAGEHTIKLVYKSPLLKLGICISILAFLLFVCFVIFSEKQVKNSEKNKRI